LADKVYFMLVVVLLLLLSHIWYIRESIQMVKKLGLQSLTDINVFSPFTPKYGNVVIGMLSGWMVTSVAPE
jgi:ABC-type phosphate transport system permease subunit